MSEPTPRLPARPSLEQLRKQAKELLRALRDGSASTIERVRAVDPRLADRSLVRRITLADAQHVIAREHGFESWSALVQHIETARPLALGRFERLAGELARAYMAGDGAAVRDINWKSGLSFVWDHEPERMRRRLSGWYASASRTMELALADARHLVAKQAGCDDWEELVASVAAEERTRGGGTRHGAGGARGVGGADGTPFFRVDESGGAMEVRGPITDREWDTVLAVMEERRLTTLRSAGLITDAALARLGRLEHVTSVDLSFLQRATPGGLRHLARLPLQTLELGGWGTQIDDEGLAVLRQLPELRAVSLVWAQHVSDAGVANLAGCARLQSVNLMGTPTGDGSLRTLSGKAQLAALEAGTRVTSAGLALLHDYPIFASPLPDDVLRRARESDGEPTHVALHPAAFVRGGLEALAGLAGLYSVRLFSIDRSIPPVTGAALRPVAGLPALYSLWCDPADDAMAVIAQMPRLRKLMCQDTAASDEGWIALGRSATLESIWGRRNRALTGRGLVAMASMPALRTLGVNLARVDDESLAALASFPALREFTPIGLGDDAFRHVGRCVRLESLSCMYTADIGDAATAHISGLARLKKYYAGDTSITDRSLELLGALPALERVELWNCPAVTNAGIAALARAPRLREVSVEGSPLVTRDAATNLPAHLEVRITG